MSIQMDQVPITVIEFSQATDKAVCKATRLTMEPAHSGGERFL